MENIKMYEDFDNNSTTIDELEDFCKMTLALVIRKGTTQGDIKEFASQVLEYVRKIKNN